MKAFEFKVLWKLVKLAVVGNLKTNEFKSGAWEPSEYDAAPVEWYKKRREEIDKCLKSKETIVDMDSLDPDFLYLIKNTNINDIHNDLEPSYTLMKNEYSKLLKMSMDAAHYGIFKLPEGSPSPEEYYKKMSLCLLHRESLEKWIVGIYRDMIGKLTGGKDYKSDGTIQQLTINGDNNMVYNSVVKQNEGVSKPYKIDDESDDVSMVAEDDSYYGYGKLDYGLVKEDFDYDERKRRKNDRWFSMKESRKPCIGEKYIICGYCYPGAVDYIVGIYEGYGNWNTVYDNGNNPEFKVLYWRDIEEIKGIENEMM